MGTYNGCILTEFGDCSYNETECSGCAIKEKIRTALSAKESMDELKPCPFCGERARLKESYGYYVQCDNGKCAVHPATNVYVIKDRAIMAWNQRAFFMELYWLLNNVNDNSINDINRNNTILKKEKKIINIDKNELIYKEESPEEIAADMAPVSPFESETWCSLLKGLNRAGYIICKKI